MSSSKSPKSEKSPASGKSPTRYSAVAPKAEAPAKVAPAATPVVKPVMAETKAPAVAPAVPAAAAVAAPVAAPVVAPVAAPVAKEQPVAAPAKVVATTPVVSAEAVATLILDLRNFDADIARDAAASLGNTANTAAVAPLINAIANADGFTHPVVRAAAAASLGQLADRSAVEPLIAAIDDTMAEASAEAIRSLGLLGDVRAVAPLIAVVQNTNGYFLPIARRAAVLALAKLPGTNAVLAIRAVSEDASEDAIIRADAQAAIAKK